MSPIEDLGEVISTDVLIIGGGIGGLVASIEVKEQSPKAEVLVVDKQSIGWAGKAPKGGGMFWVMRPEADLDKFVEWHVRSTGEYLNDQELLYELASETYGAVEQLGEWGVNVARDAAGKLDTVECTTFNPLFESKWWLAGVDADMQFPLRARARKLGVKMLSKVQVVELLKRGDQVVGAVGFNLVDGRFYIFKAKATIMANGSCNYRVRRMWSSATGDGIATAYRAGAEMRNAEFGNFFEIHWIECDGTIYDYTAFFNALGENISKRYVPGEYHDVPLKLLLGMEKETLEGRGPIVVDLSLANMAPLTAIMSHWKNRPHSDAFHAREHSKALKYGPPPSPRPEVIPALNAELTPVKVDHEMRTSLTGLWAIGDTCSEGASWAGAIYAPRGGVGGSGLMFAVLSGLRAGPSAARFASKAPVPEVDDAEVKRFKEDIFAPMKRNKGLLPVDAIYAIQDLVCKFKYNLRRSKDRLEEATSKVKEIQERFPESYAKDAHGLGKYHEARAMAVCAEMTFRSALMRTESRGFHYREDYPKRDDKNWLKWVIARQEAGKMVVSTEPVPVNKYKVRP
jgi:succinate dehydrogenase / fumarate reductase flavoprotein subunit